MGDTAVINCGVDRKRIAVIGCTGSVGSSVLSVCRAYPELFCVTALAADTGRATLPDLCREFNPESVILKHSRNDLNIVPDTRPDALVRLVESGIADHFVFASSGVDAVPALARALELNREISLANKESALILGARLASYVASGSLRPLDSEHNAVWQCLRGENLSSVSHLVLTASGGPFLRTPLSELGKVSPEQAAAHPVWSMGRKISVDSATMINKGIELLEARCLFGLPGKKISALIHPGSRVHGAVEFVDGAVKLLASPPDMRLAALTAMAYPARPDISKLGLDPLNPDGMDLHFEIPEEVRFPGFALASRIALSDDETPPVILIAADQAAVELFLAGKLSFTGISELVERVVTSYNGGKVDNLHERTLLYGRGYEFTLRLGNGEDIKRWN